MEITALQEAYDQWHGHLATRQKRVQTDPATYERRCIVHGEPLSVLVRHSEDTVDGHPRNPRYVKVSAAVSCPACSHDTQRMRAIEVAYDADEAQVNEAVVLVTPAVLQDVAEDFNLFALDGWVYYDAAKALRTTSR